MKKLSLNELTLGMKDLVEKRMHLLESTAVGRLYKPLVVEMHTRLEVMASASPKGMARALAAEINAADAEHDRYGSLIADVVETYLAVPSLSDTSKVALEKIRSGLVPSRAELQAPYAEEAARASARRANLPGMKDELESFPVVDGATLADWAERFVAAGERLGELLGARANQHATSSSARAAAPSLLSEGMGILGRMRVALRDEVAMDASHPRNLERLVFGTFDEIGQLRGARGRKEPAGSEPTPVGNPA